MTRDGCLNVVGEDGSVILLSSTGAEWLRNVGGGVDNVDFSSRSGPDADRMEAAEVVGATVEEVVALVSWVEFGAGSLVRSGVSVFASSSTTFPDGPTS